jgi:hypothetical protein
MADEQIHQLKRALLDEYGTFADRRIKDIDRGDRFIVDGRTDGDIASDGQVYGWFCSMFLEVKGAEQVALTVVNLPMSDAVAAWLATNAEVAGRGIRVLVPRAGQAMLAELRGSVAAITARGQRYDTPSYKYAVPRVSAALGRLETALGRGWAS